MSGATPLWRSIVDTLINGPMIMALGGACGSIGGMEIGEGHYAYAAVLIIVSCPLWGLGKARFRREVLASDQVVLPTT